MSSKRYVTVNFDPIRSAEFVNKIINNAKVKASLIGTVRTWPELPPEAQLQTKDLDMAVLQEDTVWIEEALNKANIPHAPCDIGGVSVDIPTQSIRVDFVDRRVEIESLFREAVTVAYTVGDTINLGDNSLIATPLEYIVAMKLAPARDKDDIILDALLRHSEFDYNNARAIVLKHLGAASAYRLDRMAKRAGRLK